MFQSLLEAGRDRQIALKIAQNLPSRVSPNVDAQILAKKANAQVILQFAFDDVEMFEFIAELLYVFYQ